MTNPPTPQMPKPHIRELKEYYDGRHLMHGWVVDSETGTTTIEQFAQEKADRVEELEAFVLRMFSYEPYEAAMDQHDCIGHDMYMSPEDRKLVIELHQARNYPGEKGAEG